MTIDNLTLTDSRGRRLVLDDDGNDVTVTIRDARGAQSPAIEVDLDARQRLVSWLTGQPRPYTDAELARDPAAVTASLKAVDVDAELAAARDRTLALKALADLADRVRALEARVDALADEDTRTTEEVARAFRDSSARLEAEQPLPPAPKCPNCGQRTVLANSSTGRVCHSCAHEWQV